MKGQHYLDYTARIWCAARLCAMKGCNHIAIFADCAMKGQHYLDYIAYVATYLVLVVVPYSECLQLQLMAHFQFLQRHAASGTRFAAFR